MKKKKEEIIEHLFLHCPEETSADSESRRKDKGRLFYLRNMVGNLFLLKKRGFLMSALWESRREYRKLVFFTAQKFGDCWVLFFL